MAYYLPIIWALIIGLGVFVYVCLDGFDLGLGILFPFFEDKEDREVMMNTVAPVWDGNETFLVLGGAGLYGAFPVVFSTLLPACYMPLMLMLVGLIFRGAAFELRGKANRSQLLWDLTFAGGSALSAFCQGITLGTILQGIKIVDGVYAGGQFDWFTPFSVLCGIGVMTTYATLGCGWLIYKTDGKLQADMRTLMRPLIGLLTFLIAVVSLWSVIGLQSVQYRWFGSGWLVFLLPVPLAVIFAVIVIFKVAKTHEFLPFLLTLFLCFLGYTGLVISFWPNIIPPSLTIWQASSVPMAQGFALIGTIIILPIILVYSAMQYWVFRGKVRHGDVGYH
jgi:cytochrome d ubiquinol oxidase subunit II